MVSVYTRLGKSGLIKVDIKTREWHEYDLGIVGTPPDPLAALAGDSFLVIGSRYDAPMAIYRVSSAGSEVVRWATDDNFPPSIFSRPQLIKLTSKGEPKRPIYGFFWPPHNPDFQAPEGTLPPVIVNPHGGPTACTMPGLRMIPQYWVCPAEPHTPYPLHFTDPVTIDVPRLLLLLHKLHRLLGPWQRLPQRTLLEVGGTRPRRRGRVRRAPDRARRGGGARRCGPRRHRGRLGRRVQRTAEPGVALGTVRGRRVHVRRQRHSGPGRRDTQV